MRGMTGFGRAEHSTGKRRIAVEVKSYNSRYLEIQVGVPPGYGELEPRLRAEVAERVSRGRVELALSVADLAGAVEVSADTAAARAYIRALRELSDVAGGGPVTLSNLLAVGGFLNEWREPCVEGVWGDCRQPLEQAFAQFDAACRRDGDVTAADLRRLLAEIAYEVDRIEAEAPRAAERQRGRPGRPRAGTARGRGGRGAVGRRARHAACQERRQRGTDPAARPPRRLRRRARSR